jgi:hypothetical protein
MGLRGPETGVFEWTRARNHDQRGLCLVGRCRVEADGEDQIRDLYAEIQL